MRKIYSVFTALILAAGLAVSPCSAKSVTISIFPIYDWVQAISNGVSNDITLLLDKGVDLHSYQPSAEDIVKISGSDLFIYVGGESDEWADEVLKVSAGGKLSVITLLDVLGNAVKKEVITEGMERGPDDDDEPDEHVWLSLRNAAVICRKIAAVLSDIDTVHRDIYASNLAGYLDELSALDEEYSSAVRNSARKVILFGDRFPFRYLADDYGLKYYAAFSGCSAESEASFKTVIFLAGKVDELNLPCVLKIDGTNHKIAETVIKSTKNHNRSILVLDSMQSATMKDIEAGKTYLDVMRRNLEILKEALN